MVSIRRIGIFIGLMLGVALQAQAQTELVRPADFRYYVTVDADTVSSRSLDYKAIQDSFLYKQMNCDATVTVHPIGLEARECFDLTEEVVDTLYLNNTVYESIIEVVDWQHRQSAPDEHVLYLEITHNADSINSYIETCGQTFQSGELINCSENAYIYTEGIKDNRTLTVQDSVDLKLMNELFLETMPFSGFYAKAPFATNPTSDLTDYVALIDLSLLPQSWWDEVDTSDGTRGRAAKDDGTTELASEWVEFDDVNETGFVWVKWSGTLPASSGATIRIYPPKSTNDSYAITDTYGKNAVWSNFYFVSHKDALPLEDSSGNIANGTTAGSPTVVSGKIGDAVDYPSGDTDYASHPHPDPDSTSEIEFGFWLNPDATGGSQMFSSAGDFSELTVGLSSGNYRFYIRGASGGDRSEVSSMLDTGWQMIHNFYDPSNANTARIYKNGTEQSYSSTTITTRSGTSDADMLVSGPNAFWAGFGGLMDFLFYRIPVSDDYRSYEYANQNSPSTFWGTWTTEGGETGATITADTLTQSQVLSEPDVSVAYTLSPDGLIQSQSLFSPELNVFYTVTPETLTQAQLLSQATVQSGIVITPNGLIQEQVLESADLQPFYTFSPDTITQGQSLSDSALQLFYELVADDLTQSQALSSPDVSMGFLISPENLTQIQSLDQVSVEPVYIFTPEDLEQSQTLSDVVVGTIGKATKGSTTVKPLYVISTKAKKLYIIETEINPIING